MAKSAETPDYDREVWDNSAEAASIVGTSKSMKAARAFLRKKGIMLARDKRYVKWLNDISAIMKDPDFEDSLEEMRGHPNVCEGVYETFKEIFRLRFGYMDPAEGFA